MENIEIREDFIKLDSFMKFSGAVNSGGIAKFEIQGGFVKVNDEVCTMRGKKLYSEDIMEYQGKSYKVIKASN